MVQHNSNRPGSRTRSAGASTKGLFVTGENCWRVAKAEKASVLVDAAAYFTALEAALRAAEKSILIVGWDFDGRIRLRPQESESRSPPLGELLHQLLDAKPELTVQILVWSVAVVDAPGASSEKLVGADWQSHPRLTLRLDTHHPAYAALHEKIVCIDECLAFAGGIDLTIGRWDRPKHEPNDPLRKNPDGKTYQPFHDLHMIVSGEIARALRDHVNIRWKSLTGKELPPCRGPVGKLWPKQLVADYQNIPVAIARTRPEYEEWDEVTESAVLTVDAIRSASDIIYIETQFLTAEPIGEALAERLSQENGPEVIILRTHYAEGLIERLAMGINGDRFIRRLRKSDRNNRLRVVYPVVEDEKGQHQDIYVHSKLLIVDNRFLRVGSANFSNRSVGLDTECDLAVEARNDEEERSIESLRLRLLAEHLGKDEKEVDKAIAENGSVGRTIDELGSGGRGVRAFDAMQDDGPVSYMFGTSLLDPRHVFRLIRG